MLQFRSCERAQGRAGQGKAVLTAREVSLVLIAKMVANERRAAQLHLLEVRFSFLGLLLVTDVQALELSMVVEEQEKEQRGGPNPIDGTEHRNILQSPGAMSNLSGTTALTSQSTQKIADLDTGMIVELLPDLSREAFRLLDLLAPSNASASDIENVVKELQVPGSGRGKRLRLREKTFDSTKENYTGALFINPELVLRKIFGDQSLDAGDFRPDLILYASNIATLVKELLVAQQNNPSTMDLLRDLDDIFPTPFLSGYEHDPQGGSSALYRLTFDLALELRTQTCLTVLKNYQDEANYDPDQLLAQLFFEPPLQRDSSLSTYVDAMTNGQLRKIAGYRGDSLNLIEERSGVEDSHAAEIRKRVEAIREAFRFEDDAIEEGDYVDFDRLNDRFPWTSFLANVVQWSQSRMEEVNRGIEKQGGIENITRSLIDKIQSSDHHIELYYEPPKATQPTQQVAKSKSGLLPAATIIPASAGKR
jgi:hypothetical protein